MLVTKVSKYMSWYQKLSMCLGTLFSMRILFPFHYVPENSEHVDPFHKLVMPNPIYSHDSNEYEPNIMPIENNPEHDLHVPISS